MNLRFAGGVNRINDVDIDPDIRDYVSLGDVLAGMSWSIEEEYK